MTAAAGDRQGAWDWFVEWAGHHSWAYWLVLMSDPLLNAALGGYSTFVTGAALVTVIVGFKHDRKTFCLRCLRNTPLDPQSEIQRYDRRLRLVHSYTPKFLLIGMALWLTVALGGGWVVASLGAPLWANVILAILMWTPFVYSSLSGEWHQWLRPWCPYCRRWDDGGTPEVVPDPVPSAEKEKA